jgi:hypothetical protein
LFLFFLLTETVLGLDNAINKKPNAAKRNRYKKGFNFAKIDVSALNPLILGIVKIAASFFLVKKYQTANAGIKISSHKNSGFKNSKLFQFIIFFNNWFRF